MRKDLFAAKCVALGLCWFLTSSTSADAQAHWQFITAVGDEELWPEPPFARIDVYVDSVLVADNIWALAALPLAEHAPGTLMISVAPNGSTSIADAFMSIPFELNDGDTVAAILTGFLDPAAHPANPNGLDTSLKLLRVPHLKSTPDTDGSMEIRLVHATPSIEPFGLVDDLPSPSDTAFASGPYGWFGDYTVLPASAGPFAHYWAVGLESSTNYCQVGFEVTSGSFLGVTSGFVVNMIALITTDGQVTSAGGTCNVGIEDVSNEESDRGLVAYPNPSGSRVTVRLPGSSRAGALRLELYDLLGRAVDVRPLGPVNAQSEIDVDVSRLPSGIYFAVVSGRDALARRSYVVKVHVAR